MISAAWNFLASLRNDRLTLSENPLNAVMALKERATQKMKTTACFEDRNSCRNMKGRCIILPSKASILYDNHPIRGLRNPGVVGGQYQRCSLFGLQINELPENRFSVF